MMGIPAIVGEMSSLSCFSLFQLLRQNIKSHLCMAENLPIRRKTLSNQLINQSINNSTFLDRSNPIYILNQSN